MMSDEVLLEIETTDLGLELRGDHVISDWKHPNGETVMGAEFGRDL